MRKLGVAAGWLVAAGLLLSALRLNAAEFQGLGDLPGGRFFSSPSDMAVDGTVVVGRSDSRVATLGDGREAFVWTPDEGIIGLGFLPSTADYVATQSRGVSSDGTVVVGLGSHWSGGRSGLETFRWTRNEGLQSIGIPDNGTQAMGTAISGDGRIIAGTTLDGSGVGGNEIFRWTEDVGFEILGTLPWSPFDRAGTTDLSRDGTTIVGVESDGVGIGGESYNSFIWREDTGFQRISNPNGSIYYRNEATSVSDDGSVVAGDVDGSNGSSDAFVWTEQVGLTPLKFHHDPDLAISAYDISGDGTVVVGQMFRSGEYEHVAATIWDEFRGTRNLQQLLQAQLQAEGMADVLDGWQLRHAFVVSQDGSVVAGLGINPQGHDEAWRAVLDPEPAPILIPGDANLDGVVDRLDLERVQANLGIGSFWYQGNFDGIGRVDEADLAIVRANIPEPSTAGLALATLLSAYAYWGKRRMRFIARGRLQSI